MPPEQLIVIVGIVMLLLMMLSFAAFMLMVLRPWLQAFTAGAPVSIISIIGMRLRGNPPKLIVETLVALKHRGIAVSTADVERVYLANKGQVDNPSRLAGMVEEKLRRQAEATNPATPS